LEGVPQSYLRDLRAPWLFSPRIQVLGADPLSSQNSTASIQRQHSQQTHADAERQSFGGWWTYCIPTVPEKSQPIFDDWMMGTPQIFNIGKILGHHHFHPPVLNGWT